MPLKTLQPAIRTLGTTTTPSTSTKPLWNPDSHRGSRHQRGYGWPWEKRREEIKQRAKGLCEPHLAEGIVHLGNECDHIKPKAQCRAEGWTKEQMDDPSNLQWCCKEYHLEKSRREMKPGGGYR